MRPRAAIASVCTSELGHMATGWQPAGGHFTSSWSLRPRDNSPGSQRFERAKGGCQDMGEPLDIADDDAHNDKCSLLVMVM